jgi:hypothetical protein
VEEAVAVNDPQAIPYQEALFRLNDLCGQRVRARVRDMEGEILAVDGTLRHDTEQGAVWGCYFVDDAPLNVTAFQDAGPHRIASRGVAFNGDGVFVDVWPTGEDG